MGAVALRTNPTGSLESGAEREPAAITDLTSDGVNRGVRLHEQVGGNVSEAARVLGLHRNSLKTKLARWKLAGGELEEPGAQ